MRRKPKLLNTINEKLKRNHKSLRLGFTIEKLDDIIEKLKEENIEIVREPKEPEWGYFAIIKDLDGRKIELKEKPAGNAR